MLHWVRDGALHGEVQQDYPSAGARSTSGPHQGAGQVNRFRETERSLPLRWILGAEVVPALVPRLLKTLSRNNMVKKLKRMKVFLFRCNRDLFGGEISRQDPANLARIISAETKVKALRPVDRAQPHRDLGRCDGF